MAANEGVYSPFTEPSRNDQVAVGTTSTQIAYARNAENPRKVIVFRNTSTAAADIITINLGFGAAVANKGIVLRQYESFTDSMDGGYQCWQGMITAICATANGLLSVMER